MSPGTSTAVLLYHQVSARAANTHSWLTVDPAAFERQISTLARHGYSGISARQWICRSDGRAPRKPVVITFDDGYAALHAHALPMLVKYGFTATVFVVTDLVGGFDEWLRKEGTSPQPLMTAEQIRYWAKQGIEFGAHSRTHADLTTLTGAALDDEVAGSRRALESLLGAPVVSFAYPYGVYNDAVVACVRREFDVAFRVKSGMNDATTDRYLLRRTMVAPTDGAIGMRWRASFGCYPVQVWRRRFATRWRRLQESSSRAER